MSRYFPLFIDLEGKKILVVGAGHIAERRILTLLSFGAQAYGHCAGGDRKDKEAGRRRSDPLAGKMLETLKRKTNWRAAFWFCRLQDDTSVNEAVFSACKRRAIPVNCADDRTRCDFYFPGIAEGGGVTAGITAGGTNHRLAREATEKVRELLSKM